eukprot:gene16896-20092_t
MLLKLRDHRNQESFDEHITRIKGQFPEVIFRNARAMVSQGIEVQTSPFTYSHWADSSRPLTTDYMSHGIVVVMFTLHIHLGDQATRDAHQSAKSMFTTLTHTAHPNSDIAERHSTPVKTQWDGLPPSSISKAVRKKQVNTEIERVEFPPWASRCLDTIESSRRVDHSLRFFKGGEPSSFFTIPLSDLGFIVFGRSSTLCDYVLSHPTISRKHALIAYDLSGTLKLQDLNSSHGTFVDRHRILPESVVALRHGQRVYLGGDASYLEVHTPINYAARAEHLLTKKSLLTARKQQSQFDTMAEAEEESLKDEITRLCSDINKSMGAHEVDSMHPTIKKLTPSSSPSKKYTGKRKSSSQEQKSVTFSGAARYTYSDADSLDQTYPTIQSENFNDRVPTNQAPATTTAGS